MVQNDASDLYLTVDRPPSYKISGSVKSAGKKNLDADALDEIIREVTKPEDYDTFRKKHELNIAYFDQEIGRFRFNFYQQKGSSAIVIRKIETNIKTLEDLKLPPTLADVSMAKRGLVLVVGATGSGKSTTLAAMVNHRNANEPGHIITIEDPIEFVHEHKKCVVSQREVGVDTESFKDALKNTLPRLSYYTR